MLTLEKINKKAGGFSLENIDFTVNQGDYYTIIGESGAGKSMVLEIITGFLLPDSGKVILNQTDLRHIPVQKRNIGIVYQDQSLFPHMSVYDNIAYPLKIRKYSRDEIKTRVFQLAEETEIGHLLSRNISRLSGGEKQRVAISRSLATKPGILLLDEPLSFLDVRLKKGIQSLLRKLNKQGQTIIHVTHDYEEALSLTNRTSIMEKGRIMQSGTPGEVFHNPKSPFVANFVGISNFFRGKLLDTDIDPELKIFETSGKQILLTSSEEPNTEGHIILPGNAIIVSGEKLNSSAVNNFQGVIKDFYQTKLGIDVVIDIGFDLTSHITNHSWSDLQFYIGKSVWVSFKASSVNFLRN